MGIRRRRRKLTTLMSRMDQRVRAVELRPVSLLTSSEVEAIVSIAPPATGPETVVSASAPYQFKKVQDGYIYPKALTGLSQDRVELYTEADTGASEGDRIEVSGVHWASSEPIDVTSDNFTVVNIDEPNWSGRPSYKHDPTQDQLSGVTISHAYEFKPETAAPQTWTSRRRLQTKRKVDSFEISAAPNSTVTLTMNATHHFEVGDIIFVDIFSEDSRAYGTDGLFTITAVTGTTIEYVLTAGVDVAVSSTDVSGSDVYVYPVIREWAQDGSIWVDSSNNTTYYWDGIRWVEYTPTSEVGVDGDPPSPPTGLSVSDDPAIFGTTYEPYSKVTLSWTAPTTSQSGDPITDLAGYKVRWRRSASEDWRSKALFEPNITSYTFDDDVRLAQGTTYYFELYAFDSGQQDSTAATATHTTGTKTGDITTYAPSDPIATSRLGTITVTWDGRLKTGASTYIASPDDVVGLKIYVSTSSGFTPSSLNLAKSTTVFGADGGFDVLTDLTYNTTYYIKIKVVDTSGVESPASAQVAAQVTPLVDTDIIYSTLNTWPFVDGTVSANALADGSVTASKILGGAVDASALAANAVTSLAIAADAVTSAALATGAVTGDAIASSAITAGKIQAGAITSVTIASGAITSEKITAGAIGAQQIAADAITSDKISAGAIGADEIAAGAIIAGKIGASAVTAATIAAGAITAGKIATNAVEADKINAGAITAVKISAGAIEADKIATGAITADKIGANQVTAAKLESDLTLSNLIKTGDAGTARIEIRGKDHPYPGIVSFDGGGGTTFRFYSNGVSYLDDVLVAGNLTGGVMRTSSSFPRLELNQSTASLRMRYSSSAEAQLTNASWGAFINGDFSVTGIATGNTYSYNIRGEAFTGIFARGSVYSTSDERLKTDISNSSLGLDFVNSLEPVEFSWINDSSKKKNLGVIAQRVKETLDENYPELSDYFVAADGSEKLPNGEAAYGVHYNRFIPVLLNAVKELSSQVEELKSEVEYLKQSKDK